MIVTCGEALVDLVPEKVGPDILYRPVLGGSHYNVARCIAQLGGRSAYLWELSRDDFGQRLRAGLEDAGVDCSLTRVSDRTTPFSVVDRSGPEPRYNIADPDGVMLDTPLAALPAAIDCLLIGSATLAREPIAADIERLAATARLVAVDINARAPSIIDRDAYCARLRRIAASSAIVKASDADITLLGEGEPEAYMDELLTSGARMVVLTRAKDGAQIRTQTAQARSPSRARRVADPVGAGDAFMAALLTYLQARGALGVQDLSGMTDSELCELVDYAQAAAAFTCSRQGAAMPVAADLVEHL